MSFSLNSQIRSNFSSFRMQNSAVLSGQCLSAPIFIHSSYSKLYVMNSKWVKKSAALDTACGWMHKMPRLSHLMHLEISPTQWDVIIHMTQQQKKKFFLFFHTDSRCLYHYRAETADIDYTILKKMRFHYLKTDSLF